MDHASVSHSVLGVPGGSSSMFGNLVPRVIISGALMRAPAYSFESLYRREDPSLPM